MEVENDIKNLQEIQLYLQETAQKLELLEDFLEENILINDKMINEVDLKVIENDLKVSQIELQNLIYELNI